MVADDLAANGIEPTNLSNILDVDRLDETVVDELVRGLAAAAVESGIALTGGEIAELGERVGGWGQGMHFNWCATAIGVLPERLDRPIDGAACAPGDRIVAVQETGLRSNGFSLARRVLVQAFGERWHEVRRGDGQAWGEALLTPSRVCCRLIAGLIGFDVVPHGIAHITGGGIPDKLGRVLKVKKLGARLDGLFAPSGFVAELLALGKVGGEQAYRMWNMGNAMLLVVAPPQAEEVVAKAGELGFAARIAGTVTADPVIEIARAAGLVRFPVRCS
jgi:phosphoribosylformylglycinamidine cyclo-ligase